MEQSDENKNHDGDEEMLETLDDKQPDELTETVEDPEKEEPNVDEKTDEVEEENPDNSINGGETEKDHPDGESSKDPKENKLSGDGANRVKVFRKDGEPADLDVCRVCTSKDDLSDIFEFESSVRICDLIMKICTAVRITQRDHLPHKICKGCVEKVRIAYDFKTTCENTDKELRKTLKRAYNKSRRTTDFVIVNCPMSDEEENEEEPQDDDEYKVSQSEVESEPVTSDDSFAPVSKKKKTPRRRGRRPKIEISPPSATGVKRRRGRQPGFKLSPATPAAGTPRRGPGRPPKASKSPGLANVVYIEAPEASSSDSDDDKPIKQRKTHDCTKCDETFKTGVELKEHLQTHKGDLFPCTKCEKSFKSKVYLSNHLERHDQDERKREEKIKAKELKKQQQRQKELQKRQKEMDDRTKRPKLSVSSGGSAEKKKKVEPVPANSGRDLFKCVAPVTSTYWSDSFSD
ncbi:DNA ligase 1 isoform X2 [Malaya genurostris]|nr:DNA ligase 1 isoform X2 [Malaya genurostris]XP_058464987.1 DNA ligase 1 isoform X2 [Malaya genurostris]